MRTLVLLLGLALLAGMVTGREQPAAPVPMHAGPAPSAQPPPAPPQELDLDLLVRQRHERRFTDLFAVPSAPPPIETAPPAITPVAVRTAAPAPAAPPAAPPLPFAYLGRMVNGERIVAYVLRGEQMYLAEAGEVLGEDYRVEGVTDSAVHFVYLPLGTKQILSFPTRE